MSERGAHFSNFSNATKSPMNAIVIGSANGFDSKSLPRPPATIPRAINPRKCPGGQRAYPPRGQERMEVVVKSPWTYAEYSPEQGGKKSFGRVEFLVGFRHQGHGFLLVARHVCDGGRKITRL